MVLPLPSLLTQAEVASILAEFNARRHDRLRDMDGIQRTSLNDLPATVPVHRRLAEVVSVAVGKKVTPSYTFTSAYERCSTLPPHLDVTRCDYNISTVLSFEGGDPRSWPLYVREGDRIHSIALGIGDGALYLGRTDLHWRPMMPPELTSVTGAFFHFV